MTEQSDAETRTSAERASDATTDPDERSGAEPDASDASSESAADAPSGSDESSADATPARSGGGRGVAWLALLVALGALALAGRPFWMPVDEDPAESVAAAEVDALDRRLASLDERLDTLDDARSELGGTLRTELETLDRELGRLREDLQAALDAPEAIEALAGRVGRLEGTQSSGEASLEARMASLEQRIEQRVAALQDQLGSLGADLDAAGEARAWRLALVHARSLLIQGRDAWMLGSDADAARAAWARAESRLAGPIVSGAPDKGGLDDAMQRLLRAAESLRGPDVADRVATLDRLAAEAPGWPQAPLPSAPVDPTAPADAEAGWRDRVAGALGALVRVEAIDDAPPTPVELDRARARIAAALDAASISTARRDWATASAMIAEARTSIEADFDTDAPDVRDGLERLAALADAPEPPRLPPVFDDVLERVDEALERSE